MKKVKINLFEIIFAEGSEFDGLGFVPGKHPVTTTKNKMFANIREKALRVLKGENPHLANYKKKLTQQQILELVTKGKTLFVPGDDESEIDLTETFDKPGMLLEAIKELIETGFYTRQETAPAMKFLISKVGAMKLAASKKDNLSNLSGKEIDNFMGNFDKIIKEILS